MEKSRYPRKQLIGLAWALNTKCTRWALAYQDHLDAFEGSSGNAERDWTWRQRIEALEVAARACADAAIVLDAAP